MAAILHADNKVNGAHGAVRDRRAGDLDQPCVGAAQVGIDRGREQLGGDDHVRRRARVEAHRPRDPVREEPEDDEDLEQEEREEPEPGARPEAAQRRPEGEPPLY